MVTDDIEQAPAPEDGPPPMSREEREALAEAVGGWIATTLHDPSPEHGGMSACPFARPHCVNTGLSISVGPTLTTAARNKAFDAPDPVALHLLTAPISLAAFRRWIAIQNGNHMHHWITGWHPDDPDLPAVLDWLRIEGFSLLKIIRLDAAEAAHRHLAGTAYYHRPSALRDATARSRAYNAHQHHRACGYVEGHVHAMNAARSQILH